jgi:flavin reductase (DIM6/NTAB) family NADH-FMN oxidoreductase RutF
MNNDLTYKNENIKNFKKIMSHFATGVCVLTSIDENSNYEKLNFTGITINSFNSVSLNPQLILYSLAKNGSNFDKLLNSKNFFINILSENQKDISNLFAFQKDFSNFKDFDPKLFIGLKS